MIVNLTDSEVEYIRHCLGLANISASMMGHKKTSGQFEFLAEAAAVAIQNIIESGEDTSATVFAKFFPDRLTAEELEAFLKEFKGL